MSFDTLIRTKLRVPFVRPALVPRPRLQARMAEGLRRPLTLVAAPAGFGKTTLVASNVADADMPVAWLSLDKDDNQPGRFMAYLVAALQEADEAIGGEVAPLLAAGQPVPPEMLLTSLVNDLERSASDVALVLDDYQFISSQPVHDAVAFLLDHSPARFHLVIATRSDPPLPLARLRARGQTVELRAADLGFTRPEAAQFLNELMGLHLDVPAVAVLAERTEGWIAGLQMAALSLQNRADADDVVRAFAGTHRFIMDFMLEEVLSREPEAVQTFLLQTAFLTRLTGPLCDAVTGNAGGQAMLEWLEQRNLFVVPLDDRRRWYRYHHLFADLLQARLRQSEPEQVARLLSRAAEWCEAEGQVADAVGYALAAGDYSRAANLIGRYWHHAVNNGQIETVWSWLKALPEEVIRRSALLGLAYCWVLWFRGEIGAMAAHLADAEAALNKAEALDPDSVLDTGLPAHLAVLRSIVARHDGDLQAAAAFAERALRLAPEDLPPQETAQLCTVTFMALASAYEGAGDLEKAVAAYAETIRWSRRGDNPGGIAGMTHWLIGVLWLLGRLRAAHEACRGALAYLEQQGMARLPVAGILHLRMAEIQLERNDLEAAEVHLAQGIELGKWSGRFDAALNAAPVLARLRRVQGDVEGALDAIRETQAAWGESTSLLSRAELLALKARMLLWQGSPDEAARCVEDAARLAGRDRGQIGEKVTLAACRVQAAQSNPDEAIAGLSHALAAAEDCGRWGAAIELRILRGLALAQCGDTRKALTDLECALALAEPEGYARIFLDEGRPLQRLLVQWLAQAAPGSLRDYAARLLSHFTDELSETAAPEKTAPTGGLIDPLSQRELEVLHLLSLGCTNKEIARRLIIAPGTVKAHTASIYRKLDVANRTEAVARARQVGILA